VLVGALRQVADSNRRSLYGTASRNDPHEWPGRGLQYPHEVEGEWSSCRAIHYRHEHAASLPWLSSYSEVRHSLGQPPSTLAHDRSRCSSQLAATAGTPDQERNGDRHGAELDWPGTDDGCSEEGEEHADPRSRDERRILSRADRKSDS